MKTPFLFGVFSGSTFLLCAFCAFFVRSENNYQNPNRSENTEKPLISVEINGFSGTR